MIFVKISQNFIKSPIKLWFISQLMAWINTLVKIANREDPDQTDPSLFVWAFLRRLLVFEILEHLPYSSQQDINYKQFRDQLKLFACWEIFHDFCQLMIFFSKSTF